MAVAEAQKNKEPQLREGLSAIDKEKLSGWYEEKHRGYTAKTAERAFANIAEQSSPVKDAGSAISTELGDFAKSVVDSLPTDWLERDELRDARDSMSDLREFKMSLYKDRTGPDKGTQQREDLSDLEKIERMRANIEEMIQERNEQKNEPRVKFEYGDELDLQWLKEKFGHDRDEDVDRWKGRD